MCTSLYEPNEKFMKLFNNLDFAYLKKIEEIETVNLDFYQRTRYKVYRFYKNRRTRSRVRYISWWKRLS